MEQQSNTNRVVYAKHAAMIRVPVLDGEHCIGYDYYSIPEDKRREANVLSAAGQLSADCVTEWNLARCRKDRA